MSSKVLKLFALGVLCGLLVTPLLLDIFLKKHTPETEVIPPAGFPTGTPGNSAPPFALAACVGKQFGESCELSNGTTTISGICTQSGDQLACGPSLPTQQK